MGIGRLAPRFEGRPDLRTPDVREGEAECTASSVREVVEDNFDLPEREAEQEEVAVEMEAVGSTQQTHRARESCV